MEERCQDKEEEEEEGRRKERNKVSREELDRYVSGGRHCGGREGEGTGKRGTVRGERELVC